MPRPTLLRPRGRTLLLAAALAFQLAACGSAAATQAPTAVAPSAVPSAGPGGSPVPSNPPATTPPAPGLLLEVTSEGGFINPSASLGAVPAVVVDTDGRIYTPAVAAGGSAAPLVAAVDVRDVGPAGAARILEAIRAAGLDHEGAGGGIVGDSGSSVFTVVLGGNTIVSRFGQAGGPGRPGGGGPGASGDPTAMAFDLLTMLTDPSQGWGSAAAPATRYSPVGYRVFEAPGAPTSTPGGASVPWPLAPGLVGFGAPAVPDRGVSGLRSGVVTGADATALASALAAATPATAFTSGGQPYTLWVRPLFPDELAG